MTLDVNGQIKSATETGDGPVDAIFKCIKNLYPHDVNLQLYQVSLIHGTVMMTYQFYE